MILHRLLTGIPPFKLAGLPITDAIALLAGEMPELPPSNLSRELTWVLRRALERDPQKRYSSVNKLAQELRRFLSNKPVLAGP